MSFIKKHKTLFSDLGLVYAAAIWGSTFYIVKDVLNDIDPIMLVAYRFLLASVILGGYLIIKNKDLFKNFRYGIILGLILGTLYIAQTIGLKHTSASNSGFITGLFVMFIPIFGLMFFKKKISTIKVVSIFLALSGLWVLTGGLADINFGDMLTLIAAVTYALHVLYCDVYVKKKIDPYILSFQQFLVIGILSLFIGLSTGASLTINSVDAVYSVLFLTLFPTVSAFVIQLLAQKNTDPIKVGVIFSLEPVFAAMFAWTLGSEIFVANKAFGGILIVSAMVLSELKFNKKSKNGKKK